MEVLSATKPTPSPRAGGRRRSGRRSGGLENRTPSVDKPTNRFGFKKRPATAPAAPSGEVQEGDPTVTADGKPWQPLAGAPPAGAPAAEAAAEPATPPSAGGASSSSAPLQGGKWRQTNWLGGAQAGLAPGAAPGMRVLPPGANPRLDALAEARRKPRIRVAHRVTADTTSAEGLATTLAGATTR